jgi:hypothetical protein
MKPIYFDMQTYKKLIGIKLFILFAFSPGSKAQKSFPEKCLGTWKGQMLIYKEGIAKDSVRVVLKVTRSDDQHTFGWKTSYLSEKTPMVKDYLLRLSEEGKNIYILDEGDGVELQEYLFGNKLYSVFETNDILLTSSYELIDDKLIFEVTSGKRTEQTKSVQNYSVNFLQRVIFKREP